jgi:hypothetical protein
VRSGGGDVDGDSVVLEREDAPRTTHCTPRSNSCDVATAPVEEQQMSSIKTNNQEGTHSHAQQLKAHAPSSLPGTLGL